MSICYHCGDEAADALLCVKCGQQYCIFHIDPIIHECNLVIESNILQTDINNLQEVGLDLFQGSKWQVSITPQGVTESPIKKEQFLDFLQDKGWIKLDRVITENLVDDIIRSQINFGLDTEFIEFIKNNYRGLNLSDLIDRFKHHSVVEDLGLWLRGIDDSRLDYEEAIKNFPGTFRDLLVSHFLHLRDGSYLGEINGLDSQTGNSINTKIKIKSTINVSRMLLTYISEHARQSGKNECTGFIIGTRNSNGEICELEGYFPLRIGTETMTQIRLEDFTKFFNHIGGDEKRLVGWYHSHPKFGSPTYSTADQVSHVLLSKGYSIYSFLKKHIKKISDVRLYKFSTLLSHFSRDQIEYLLGLLFKPLPKRWNFYNINYKIEEYILECYQRHGYDPSTRNSGIPISIENYLGILNGVKSYFLVLKQSFSKIYKRFRVGNVSIDFKILPFVGLVICPSWRYIAVLECSRDNDYDSLDYKGYNCYYYRINDI